jgi:hypothetical protein
VAPELVNDESEINGAASRPIFLKSIGKPTTVIPAFAGMTAQEP